MKVIAAALEAAGESRWRTALLELDACLALIDVVSGDARLAAVRSAPLRRWGEFETPGRVASRDATRAVSTRAVLFRGGG